MHDIIWWEGIHLVTLRRSKSHIMRFRLVFVAACIDAVLGSCTLNLQKKPVSRISSLDGCYEPRGGLPDFMRPRHHWAFRLQDGVIYSREGLQVSVVNLFDQLPNLANVTFTPGIVVASNSHKASDVFPGDATTGNAFFQGEDALIQLNDSNRTTNIRVAC